MYDNMAQELTEWVFDSARAQGDTAVITVPLGETQTTYVMYYVGVNEPEWYLNIENTLLIEAMNNYMEEISADCKVEDPKGNLNYLAVRAAEEAARQESQDAEGESQAADGEGSQDSQSGQDSEGGQQTEEDNTEDSEESQ